MTVNKLAEGLSILRRRREHLRKVVICLLGGCLIRTAQWGGYDRLLLGIARLVVIVGDWGWEVLLVNDGCLVVRTGGEAVGSALLLVIRLVLW